MRMKNIYTIGLLSFTLSIFAADQHDWYASLGMGVTTPGNDISIHEDSSYVLYRATSFGTSIFQLPNVQWNNHLSTGFEGSIALGNKIFKQWRAESEFLYQNMERDMSGTYDWQERSATTGAIQLAETSRPIAHSQSTVNVFSLLTNLVYDFNNNTAWTPFAGAGLGIAWIKSKGTKENNILYTTNGSITSATPSTEYSPELYGTAFAWQVKLGLNYAWNEQLSIDGLYRLLGTTQFQQHDGKIITNPGVPGDEAIFRIPQNDVNGLLDNSIYLGFRYSFD